MTSQLDTALTNAGNAMVALALKFSASLVSLLKRDVIARVERAQKFAREHALAELESESGVAAVPSSFSPRRDPNDAGRPSGRSLPPSGATKRAKKPAKKRTKRRRREQTAPIVNKTAPAVNDEDDHDARRSDNTEPPPISSRPCLRDRARRGRASSSRARCSRIARRPVGARNSTAWTSTPSSRG